MKDYECNIMKVNIVAHVLNKWVYNITYDYSKANLKGSRSTSSWNCKKWRQSIFSSIEGTTTVGWKNKAKGIEIHSSIDNDGVLHFRGRLYMLNVEE